MILLYFKFVKITKLLLNYGLVCNNQLKLSLILMMLYLQHSIRNVPKDGIALKEIDGNKFINLILISIEASTYNYLFIIKKLFSV